MIQKLITLTLHIVSSALVVTGVFQTYNVEQNNAPLGKIAIDKRTGYLYIGGQNILLQLYGNLSLINELSVGPLMDNPLCYPYPEPCAYTRELTDNKIHVLAINQQSEYILACGTVNHGLCSAYSLSDIGAMNRTLNPKIATNNIVGSVNSNSFSNSYAFFGAAHSSIESSNGLVLYVGMGTANQPLEFTPALISTREVDYSSDPWNMEYFLDSKTSSSFKDIHDNSMRKSFRSYYIYGFEKKGYTYFVSVQMNDPSGFEVATNKFVTKIIQICQDDIKYSSYTELPIQCVVGDQKYHIATSARLSDHGYLPFSDYEYLYVTFGKQDSLDPNPDKNSGSVLCTFELNKIIAKFEKLQKDCFSYGSANEVSWSIPSRASVQPCDIDMSQNLSPFCGGNKNTNGIQESSNPIKKDEQTLKEAAVYWYPMSILSSVDVVKQNDQIVALVGTDDGYLMKVLVKEPSGGQLSSNFMKYDITNNRNVKIEPEVQIDQSGKNIYLLSGSQVTKFPLDVCEVHTTCEQCVGTDPLGCGWCGGKCTLQKDCDSNTVWSGQSCSPVIDRILPMAGPLSGSTMLTVVGRNFGTRAAEVREITIGDDSCQIKNFNSTVITCLTAIRTAEGQDQVKVTVNDSNNTPFHISGEFTSVDFIYYYKVPLLRDFTPKLGPISGGSNLVISGSNMDIGSHHSVTIGGQVCLIEPRVGIQSTSITCKTPNFKYNEGRRRKKRETTNIVYDVSVTVNIDGFISQLAGKYEYRTDSTITSISPQRSIQSGGTTVTVTGTNLHIVAEPMIIAELKDGRQTQEIACYNASLDGTTLYCPAPRITEVLDNPLVCCDYKLFYLRFIMDGIANLKQLPASVCYIHYYIDPVFHRFTEDNYIKYFLISQERLEIKGEHFTYGLTMSDVKVRIGNSYCEVIGMRSTVISCKPVDKPSSVGSNEPRRTVEVIVGQKPYDIGELVYIQAPSSAMSPGLIAMAVILVLVIACIIILVLIMRRKGINPCKRTNAKHTAQYAPGREVGLTGLDPAGQRVFDMQNNQNAPEVKISEKNSEVNIKVSDNNEGEKKAYNEQRMSGELDNGASSGIVLDEHTLLVLRDKNLLIEREWLTLGEIIGKGHFGCVYRGYLEKPNVKGSTLVAVKTLHQDDPRQLDVDSFIEEALRMRDFHHPNVLTLTGICFGMDDMPLVILPFMQHGDLLSYIRNENNNPTIKDLIKFGIDVAKGMEYLSSLKFVHRDLAARNCMLDENFHAVVGDFGLSRDIYAKDYYASDNKKTKLPVKWMAPECLEKGNYNSQSDVWSFGVVLWELMTRGVNPYPEVDNWDVLRYIKKGRRMPQPPFCPDILYKMMSKCWSFNPSERPKFSELVHETKEMITVLEQQMKQGQHTTDINSTYVNTDTCTDYHYHDNNHAEEEEEEAIALA